MTRRYRRGVFRAQVRESRVIYNVYKARSHRWLVWIIHIYGVKPARARGRGFAISRTALGQNGEDLLKTLLVRPYAESLTADEETPANFCLAVMIFFFLKHLVIFLARWWQAAFLTESEFKEGGLYAEPIYDKHNVGVALSALRQVMLNS